MERLELFVIIGYHRYRNLLDALSKLKIETGKIHRVLQWFLMFLGWDALFRTAKIIAPRWPEHLKHGDVFQELDDANPWGHSHLTELKQLCRHGEAGQRRKRPPWKQSSHLGMIMDGYGNSYGMIMDGILSLYILSHHHITSKCWWNGDGLWMFMAARVNPTKPLRTSPYM